MLEVYEENFMDRLMNFVMWNYGDAIDGMRAKYPYKTIPEQDEHLRQTSMWAACNVINPATGITILDEFADRFVHDSILKSKILLLKEMEYDMFVVLEYRGGLITAASQTGRGIICLEIEEDIARNLAPGQEFEVLVHPWDIGKTHRAVGFLTITEVAFDPNFGPAVTESIPENPTPGVSLLQLLQNDPLLHLERTCDSLGIDSSGKGRVRMAQEIFEMLTTDRVRRVLDRLTPMARECLVHIACNGGLAEYHNLHERFGDGFKYMLDELEDVSLVARVSFRLNYPPPDVAYIAPDLFAAMYRFGSLGLKQWHP